MLESPVAFGGGPDPWENCPRVPLVRSFLPARPSSSETADGTAEPGGGSPRKDGHFFSYFLTRLVG